MKSSSIKGSKELGALIKARREELGLTAEAISKIAGVSLSTWFRYEAGGDIRKDKINSTCRALGWRSLSDPKAAEPEPEHADTVKVLSISRNSSNFANLFLESDLQNLDGNKLKDRLIVLASLFIFLDDIVNALYAVLLELRRSPRKCHVGLSKSYQLLQLCLPQQFIVDCDYDIIYRLYTIAYSMAENVGYSDWNLGMPSTVAELILIDICSNMLSDYLDHHNIVIVNGNNVILDLKDYCGTSNEFSVCMKAFYSYYEFLGCRNFLPKLCGFGKSKDNPEEIIETYTYVQPGDKYHITNWFKPLTPDYEEDILGP